MNTTTVYKHLEEQMLELKKQYEEEHCKFTDIKSLAEDAERYSLYVMRDCHLKVVIYSLANLAKELQQENKELNDELTRLRAMYERY